MDYQEIFNNFSVPVSCCSTGYHQSTIDNVNVNDFEIEVTIFSEVATSNNYSDIVIEYIL